MASTQKDILERCEQLSRLGYQPPLKPGMFVGRGFADVGSEVFYVHPGEKLLSLFTGQISTIVPSEAEKMFHVPTVDELIALIVERGITLNSLVFVDQREWKAEILHSDGSSVIVADRDLQKLLLDILIDECERR